MKKRTCLLALAFAWLFVGCSTNDWDLLEYNNTWEASLSQCVQDYSSQLSKSGVSLVKKELLTDNSIDSTSFLKSKEFCFPVYYKSYDRFDPVPLSFLEKDSVTSHVSIQTIRNRVHDCLKHQDDYQFVELEWSCDDVFTFNTIAVFDRYSHELVYDNLLGNIITKNVLDNRHKVLTRSEITVQTVLSNEAAELDSVVHVKYRSSIVHNYSKLNMKISIWGQWCRRTIIEGDSIARFEFDWTNTYAFTELSSDINENVLSWNDSFINYSRNNLIAYKYLLWIGPASSRYETYSLSDFDMSINSPFVLNDADGNLEACHVEIRLDHPKYSF